MMDIGRICLKTAGREAGKYCCIVKKVDANFVMVTGPKEVTSVKRRRCNITHLEPVEQTVKISSDASDSDVMKAYVHEDIFSKLGIKKPTPEELKKHHELRGEKDKAKKERADKERMEKEKREKEAAERKRREEEKVRKEREKREKDYAESKKKEEEKIKKEREKMEKKLEKPKEHKEKEEKKDHHKKEHKPEHKKAHHKKKGKK
jgi:large subunit ribosomal protein L14e